MKPLTTMILLAGGTGSRMQAEIPKQFLMLGEKPVALHSFDLFLHMSEIDEIVVVCDPTYRHIFNNHTSNKTVLFALPGQRRQDSVYNGLQASTPSHELICIHDGARPFIDEALVQRVLKDGYHYGAATAGMPVKFTVKECDSHCCVKATPDRNYIWEIQTPQVVSRSTLVDGFSHASTYNLTVTDDTTLAELVGKKVKLTEGSHTNLKITAPSDLIIANFLLQKLTPCITTTS